MEDTRGAGRQTTQRACTTDQLTDEALTTVVSALVLNGRHHGRGCRHARVVEACLLRSQAGAAALAHERAQEIVGDAAEDVQADWNNRRLFFGGVTPPPRHFVGEIKQNTLPGYQPWATYRGP